MVFGLIVGLAAYGFSIATVIIRERNERLAEQAAVYDEELERLRQRNKELEAQLEAERETFFHGGILAATLAGIAVIGPAAMEAAKGMR